MKKKLFSVVLVTALAISLLAACGKNDKADNTNTQNSTEQTTEVKKAQITPTEKESDKDNLDASAATDGVEEETDAESNEEAKAADEQNATPNTEISQNVSSTQEEENVQEVQEQPQSEQPQPEQPAEPVDNGESNVKTTEYGQEYTMTLQDVMDATQYPVGQVMTTDEDNHVYYYYITSHLRGFEGYVGDAPSQANMILLNRGYISSHGPITYIEYYDGYNWEVMRADLYGTK